MGSFAPSGGRLLRQKPANQPGQRRRHIMKNRRKKQQPPPPQVTRKSSRDPYELARLALWAAGWIGAAIYELTKRGGG